MSMLFAINFAEITPRLMLLLMCLFYSHVESKDSYYIILQPLSIYKFDISFIFFKSFCKNNDLEDKDIR